MQSNKMLGVALLVIGIALAIYGFNLQNAFGSQVAEFLGHKNKNAIVYISFGAVAAIAGLILMLKGSNKN
jgi:uncharacterized membrane protein YidH (DUF202 family)